MIQYSKCPMNTDVVEQSSVVAFVLQRQFDVLAVVDGETVAFGPNLGAPDEKVGLPSLPVVVIRIEVGCPAAPLSNQVKVSPRADFYYSYQGFLRISDYYFTFASVPSITFVQIRILNSPPPNALMSPTPPSIPAPSSVDILAVIWSFVWVNRVFCLWVYSTSTCLRVSVVAGSELELRSSLPSLL